MFKSLLIGLLVAFFATASANATCPLLDVVVYEGKSFPLASYTSPPSTEKISSWVRGLPECSASGQGRAVYRVDGKEIFLEKFGGCGVELSALDAYGRAEVPAVWLNGKFDVARGNCNGGWDPAKESFVAERGQLLQFLKTP